MPPRTRKPRRGRCLHRTLCRAGQRARHRPQPAGRDRLAAPEGTAQARAAGGAGGGRRPVFVQGLRLCARRHLRPRRNRPARRRLPLPRPRPPAPGGHRRRGAPALREVALFVVPQDAPFDPVAPWRLQLMVQRVLSVSDKAFVTFDLDYALPDVYTRAAPASAGAAAGPATATPASQGPSSAGAAQADAPADEARPNCGARSGTASRCRSPS